MTVLRSEGAGESGGDFYSYKINQSLRFNDNDSAYLHRTVGTTGNRKTWTFSCWMKGASFGSSNTIFSTSQNYDSLRYTTTGKFMLLLGNTSANLQTTALFRDPSAWYNLVVAVDTTQSTSTDRVKFYVNGSQITSFSTSTYPSQNYNTGFNHTSYTNAIGRRQSSSNLYWDSYLAEVNFIDGTALDASSFGETKDGIWIPKSSSGLTFGTNGFYLPFDDSSAIGDDESANTNDFTVNNLSAHDVVPDSPTNNFCTLNSLNSLGTLSEGNLKQLSIVTGYGSAVGSMGVTSGKWYWEVLVTDTSGSDVIGVVDTTFDSLNTGSAPGSLLSKGVDSIAYYAADGNKYINGTGTSYGAAYTTGNIIGVALNLVDNQVTFYKDNSSQGAFSYTFSGGHIVPATSDGTNSSDTATFTFNFGQDSSFAGAKTAQGNADGNGVGDFYYSPPSGFLALCSSNLPDPAIGPTADTLSTGNFNTVLYTGNNSASNRSISGVGFDPDFVWVKERTTGQNHNLFDSVRGAGSTKGLISDNTSAEGTDSANYGYINSFDSDGFTLAKGSDSTHGNARMNDSGAAYVAWNWLAGTAFSNDASATSVGTIDSEGQVNATAGFSIIKWAGTGSAGTLAHGLSKAPELIIVKNRDAADEWPVLETVANGGTHYLRLNLTAISTSTSVMWNNTNPTDSVFSLGTYEYVNASGENYISYCFHSVEAYSKVGSYTGNGSTDGTFVYTGFRPAFVLTKTITASSAWRINDAARNPFNGVDANLYPSEAADEDTGTVRMDFLSNGFKLRVGGGSHPNASTTYIYLAFAEAPFKFANAR